MWVEVLGGVERRRRWSRDEKMRILSESLEPGAKVAEVARRNDVASSVLFAWRRQARLPAATTTMVPVMIAETGGAVPADPTRRRTRGPAKERGLIEIDLGSGRRVRVDAGVDARRARPGARRSEPSMIAFPSGVRVWLATGHTDMRKGFDGLSLLVQETLKRDPHDGHLFVFRGRRGDLIKVIWHDGQGMCLFSKRLERGRFLWPSVADGTVTTVFRPAKVTPLLG